MKAGHPDLWKAMARLFRLGRALANHRFPPGVYKHHTLEESEALRQQWEDANMARHAHRTAAAKRPEK
jgi:hypothetical protein